MTGDKNDSAMAALLESERCHRTILQTSMDGHWTSDMQGRILDVNDAYCRMSGYSRQELLALTIAQLEAKESPAEIAAHIESIKAAGTARFESRHRRKDGSVYDVEVSVKHIPDIEGGRYFAFFRDITVRKRMEAERDITVRFLQLLNASTGLHELMRSVTLLLHETFDCEAAGIRLRDGDDFPYFETRGFPPDFVLAENSLCARDAAGKPVRDSAGYPILECMCGNVLCGRFDPAKPFFTARGSFWSNCTTELLASTTEADRQTRTRNRCNGEGYESVALVALRVGTDPYGLLQLNDKRKNRFTPERIALLERLADSLAIGIAHRQGQERLRESEAQYRLLADNAEDFVTLNHADGRRVYVSPSYYRVTGWTPQEIQATAWQERVHPDDLPAIEAARAANLRGERTRIEHRTLCKNGSWMWLDTHCQPTLDPDGKTQEMVLWSRDITERKRAETALKASEVRYRRLFESAKDGILILDAETGMVVDVNPFLIALLGFSREAFLGKKVWELGFLKDLFANQVNFTELQKKEYIRYEDMPLETSDGQRIEVEFVSNVYLVDQRKVIQCNIRNISDRKRAEDELRATRERFRQIVETAQEGILSMDARFLITYVNQRMADMLGYAPVEIVGRSMTDLVAPEALSDHKRRLTSGPQGMAGRYERRFCRKDGSVVTLLVSTTPTLDADKRFAGLFIMCTDLTEYKLLEKQFRQAQKMEAVGRLAGGIAHDFNNLLTVILGRADLLSEALEGSERGKRDADLIRTTAKRAAALTRQLLQFSRQDIMQPQALDLNNIVQEMEKMLRRLIGEDVELILDLAPALGRVKADPVHMQQVIMNLVVNARDAMPTGGKIIIQTASLQFSAAEASLHEGLNAGPHVVMAVIDTGCGMDDSVRARVFEPFFTTKEVGKGTGLGLSTVYGIIRQSDGSVAVSSEVGRGTIFKVYLPVTQESAKAAPMSSSALASVPGHGETILLVEDEADVRDLMAEKLTECGYAVLTATNGEDALEVSTKHPGPIDALVTDVVMPGMNGSEVAERLRQARPTMKVLFVSGYAADSVVRHGAVEGNVKFLAKPFGPAALAKRLAEMLASV
ncbi:MAG TPA: PAS domain S-box protein [Planctomycetota bacterium]|jgi:PAS domain S-box-containing protein